MQNNTPWSSESASSSSSSSSTRMAPSSAHPLMVLDRLDGEAIRLGTRTILLVTLAYWLAVAFYSLIPVLFPRHAQKHKLQPTDGGPKKRLCCSDHLAGMLLVLFNQIVVTYTSSIIAFNLFFALGGSIPIPLPTSKITILWHFLAYAGVFDVLFYTGHRLLHTPFLYKHIHSLHHKYKQPVSYCAACVHPVEFLFTYLVPNALPAVLFRYSIAELTLFVGLEAIHTVHDHCGYNFPWDPFHYLFEQNANVHDEHHRLLNVNYSGAFTMVLDRLFGTYQDPNNLSYQQRKHHKDVIKQG